MDWEAKKRCRAFYNLLVNLYPWLESEELAAGAARLGEMTKPADYQSSKGDDL